MKNFRTMSAIVSLSFFGSTMGCALSSPSTESSSDSIPVSTESYVALPGNAVRIDRAHGTSNFTMSGLEGTRPLAPNVWEVVLEGGETQHIVAGEEGHRWLVAQAQTELDALLAQPSASAEKLEDVQHRLERAQQTLASILAENATLGAQVADGVSCTLTPYAGKASAVTNPPIGGAAALAQVVCTGGCVTFTVTANACCAGSCGTNTVSKSVCSAVWTVGLIARGLGSGSASVNINPPNFTTSSTFTCG